MTRETSVRHTWRCKVADLILENGSLKLRNTKDGREFFHVYLSNVDSRRNIQEFIEAVQDALMIYQENTAGR